MTRRSVPLARALNEKGIFDMGTFYIQSRGFGRQMKHEYWDRDE